METKGGFRECALNRSIQLAKAHVQSCQQTLLFNFRVLSFKRRKQEATTIYRIGQEAVNKAIECSE